MKFCVIIPVYNEAATIGVLVTQLKRKGLEVMVIDDGCTDYSGSIAQKNGATVVSHLLKKGKGASLRDGFEHVRKYSYDGVVTMDGDGQHDVDDIDAFLNKARQNPDAVITGNRMNDHHGMPWVRLWVNRLMSVIVSAVCGQKVPDTQCGYRYIGRRVLEKIRLTSRDYEIESEVLIQAGRHRFPIYSVPVKTIYRHESSKINPIVDTARFFIFITRQIFIDLSATKQRKEEVNTAFPREKKGRYTGFLSVFGKRKASKMTKS